LSGKRKCIMPITRQDSNENKKPDKKKSAEKIDGVIAAVMATDRVTREGNKAKSVYEKGGFKTV
jgi:phage terminase large subunit-like protein